MSQLIRSFISSLPTYNDKDKVLIRGWLYRLRELSSVSFLVIKDCTGIVQCVADPNFIKSNLVKIDEPVEIIGEVVKEPRAMGGVELKILKIYRLNEVKGNLPFYSHSDLGNVGLDTILSNRALSLRNDQVTSIFKLQAEILSLFRQYLIQNHFTEIISSKIVSSGTEGGTNLFEIKYFERTAYLAQSPQFYKEQAVMGLERVFETGHVYRAEPHASSRHVTEYLSLDLELGFINGPEDIIELEKDLLTFVFENLNGKYSELIQKANQGECLPSLKNAITWEFEHCLELLKDNFGRTDLVDDLDPEAERQLCDLAKRETGIAAVFVLGFPLSARPFYTHPRSNGYAQSFDLLFNGIEITTGGQRLHKRIDLEQALIDRGIDPNAFESHLQVFDMGMPPHGGLAIGLERLTCQILNLKNVRQAILYPRDRYRLNP